MGIASKFTTWIGLGSIAIVALAAAYNWGAVSAESDNRPQSRQDAASKDDPDLQSNLSATQSRLASCEKTLQRRDHDLQKREEEPHAIEDNPAPSPVPELPKQCIVPLQAKEVQTMAGNCRSFRKHFDAYRAILGSGTLDCETVLSIRGLARIQYLLCVAVARINEEPHYQDVASDPAVIDAIEDAYVARSKYGNVDDIDELVKNPECIARMRTE